MRPPVGVALAVTIGAEGVLLHASHLSGAQGVSLAVVSAAGWGLAVSDPRLESRPRWAVTAIVLVFAMALAVPPRGSHDLWSYVMYGRTIGVHHASPYVHSPSDYPHDPFLHLVGAGWRGTTSVYGPLFTALSTALTKVSGASALRARLAFQSLALVGVVAVLVVLWIETRSARAVAFVALHPAVVIAIVNGGHNDGLVALSVLAGVVLVGHRRFTAAGIAVGLGMLVKASTGLGLIGITVWLFGRDRRAAARFLLISALITAVGYLPFGTPAFRSIAGAVNRTSRASVWSPISNVLHDSVGRAALVTVLALAVAAAFRSRSQPLPALAAVGAIAAYLFAGAYVLPWYPVWALPAAALARRSWLSILVATDAAFLVAAYEFPRTSAPWSFDAVGRAVSLTPLAVVLLTVFVTLLVSSSRGDRRMFGLTHRSHERPRWVGAGSVLAPPSTERDQTMRLQRKLIGSGAVLLALGGIGTATALAQTSGASTPPAVHAPAAKETTPEPVSAPDTDNIQEGDQTTPDAPRRARPPEGRQARSTGKRHRDRDRSE